ncbi:MAG: toll/interleukin-1 receptor domain-containing protein [Pseudanabaenales cyanobacterium]|nr:toll/interleukin-1 receptor domain-containing protein [Pseudanabaenales cyanobacterium]
MVETDHSPKIFICYARKDNESSDPNKRWLDRLLEHLGPFDSQQDLDIWSDQKIEMGSTWNRDIQTTLQNAKAAVLLVSPSFLNSAYIRNNELPILLQRAKEQGVLIVPIILRPCVLDRVIFKYPDPQNGPHTLSLASFQGANSPNQPLNTLSEAQQDKLLVSVANRLLGLVPVNP